jgi:hypothetical protein
MLLRNKKGELDPGSFLILVLILIMILLYLKEKGFIPDW